MRASLLASSPAPLRLALVTDAWAPQVNGVVRCLYEVTRRLRMGGDHVTVVAPDRFTTLPCPTYPEIRLSLASPLKLAAILDEARPDCLHIATEGPLGLLARRHALRHGLPFTTSYHTKFPEYLAARAPVPLSLSYAAMRRFHNAGAGCMVATPTLQAELAARGFTRLMAWPRGVDTDTFRPRPHARSGFRGPVFLSVGRVSVEKNLDAFLALDLPGTKVVVGDGPARKRLEETYPEAVFLGALHGEALAEIYAAADVFVFPSLTDTFGNVLLEALASGLPVAAFPVMGPKDIVTDPQAGVLSDDLAAAALAALGVPREGARRHALRFTWEESAARFRQNVLSANRASDPIDPFWGLPDAA